MPDDEVIEGQVLLFKDENDGPALGAMLFDEDGYGVFWTASELSRVTQVIDGRTNYWSSYGASLERLPTLREFKAERHRDASRNAQPGRVVLRNGDELQGYVAFFKTKDNVYSIEIYYFNADGVPFSYGGSEVLEVTQTVKDEARIYIPYHDLVFVHLLAPGHPHHIHANPFPEREDQFKNAVTRGLISALLQGGAAQLGQEGINTSSLIGAMGCGVGDVCSSHSSLRDAVEGMVPGFTKDELIFRRADQGEVVLIKKSFDDEIEPMLSRCEGFGDLSRRDKNRLLDFDHPERAVTYLNDCASKLAPDQSSTQAEVRLLEPGTKFNDELRNGGQGPSMVVIPTGRYRMGDQSESNANEVPAHRVRIERPIAVSRHEITLAEFDRFTSSTGRVKRSGQLSKQQNSPVRGIAWIDAVAYAQWLSGETGHHYRLPTEAEWEYFARAGTDTKYPWGDTITSEQVRCEACGDKKPKSEDVGQFPENAYGLYDVSGGVWEWVADCWHPEYSGAPRDGSAWMHAGDCNLRVLRGGSVDDNADQLRVGFRTAYNPVSRGNYVGFRLVRDF